MRVLLEKRGVPPHKAHSGDGEAQQLLRIQERFRGQISGGGADYGVLDEASGFNVGLDVDDVVERSVLDPFQSDFGDCAAMLEIMEREFH